MNLYSINIRCGNELFTLYAAKLDHLESLVSLLERDTKVTSYTVGADGIPPMKPSQLGFSERKKWVLKNFPP